MADQIKYKAGYKYQLIETYRIETNIRPTGTVTFEYATLYRSGELLINKGYAWDGPSGPTIDTRDFMRGSLVHDALYQMIRLGMLNQDMRLLADQELYRICREDGMSWLRSQWVYYAVRWFAASAASPASEPQVLAAP